MSLFKDDERMLCKLVRALMGYYGPAAIIQCVLDETDIVIREMSVSGHIKEAKQFSAVLDRMRGAMNGHEV